MHPDFYDKNITKQFIVKSMLGVIGVRTAQNSVLIPMTMKQRTSMKRL